MTEPQSTATTAFHQPQESSNAAWHRYLPGFIKRKLDGRHGLQAVLGNSGWLFADKLLRMGVGLLVGVWVIRYLGPEQLGLMAYAAAFAGLFGSLATLGLDSIVVRELVRDPTRVNALLGTAFRLKFIGGVVTLVLTLAAISIVRPGDWTIFILVGLSAGGFIFQSLNVIDFYFQSTVQSRFTVYALNAAFIIATVAKIVLLLSSGTLLGFAFIGLVEIVLASLFLLVVYRRNHQKASAWRFDRTMAKELLAHSWPLILSGITVMIYMRIDQIMIGEMLDDRHVGLFAASVRLSEIWYFVPAGIASSAFPAMLRAKQQGEAIYLTRVQTMYDAMTWLAIIVALGTTVVAHWIVPLLYGPAFVESADVLSIQIWAGVVVCMSYVHSAWLLGANLQRLSLFYTATGAVLNVAFNLVLIPLLGIRGAALATLIAQFSPNFIQLFIAEARPNFFMMMRSFTAPLRLLQAALR